MSGSGKHRGAAPGLRGGYCRRQCTGLCEVTEPGGGGRRRGPRAGVSGRSLDKEMMKRERYIYQGGGDRWEGGKKDKLFHNNHRKHSPSDSPKGPRRPQRRLSPEAEPEPGGGGAPGWGWVGL